MAIRIQRSFLVILLPILFLAGAILGENNGNWFFRPQAVSLAPNQPLTIVNDTTIPQVVKKSIPSVVTVNITKSARGNSGFLFPFGDPEDNSSINQNIGSGFIASSDGLVITNKHVVSDLSASYKILTSDGQSHDVVNVYRDPLNDIAILKIDSADIAPLALGDSANLQLGQTVIAIGTPLGEFQNTVTSGIVSGLGRGIVAGSLYQGSVERLDNVIQTDAPINPGNSGGPLLDLSGNVIGINTAVAAQGQNIGFAIPIDTVKQVISNFRITGGSFSQPYLGVRYAYVTDDTNGQGARGVYVIEVVSGSPADQVGILTGDVITKFDNQELDPDNDNTLGQLILQKKVGDVVRIEYLRGGEVREVDVTLRPHP